jgi:arginase
MTGSWSVRRGTARARGEGSNTPGALRHAGLSALAARNLGDAATIITSTDRDSATGVRAVSDTVRAARALAGRLDAAMRDLPGRRPLVLGGDCSILLGIAPALRRRGPVGLWFLDGRPDFLDGAASETGETADMELAVLTGWGAAALVGLAGSTPMVPAEQVVLLGHRTQDLDDAAAGELARLPAELRRVDAPTLAADPAGAGRRAARWLDRTGQGVWLHLDLDLLDQDAFPAMTYPQPGGPGWEQVALTLEPLARSPQLIGVSVADFRADLDPTGQLAAEVVALLAHVLP